MPPSRAIVLSIVLAAASTGARAQDESLDWIDWEQLDAGEIPVQSDAIARGTVSIVIAVAIDADWQAIWDLLIACEISPEYVPNVKECKRIGTLEGGQAELFEQVVKPAFFLPRFDHTFRLDYHPPDRIDVRHVSGPIDRMEGSWRLIERPNRTIALVHSMTVKPGFPVPRLFVRNTLESDLPKVLAEIRRRAEAAPRRALSD